LLRVPLVLVPPRADTAARRGVRVDSQVRLEDVAATILEIAGVDTAQVTDGKSLLSLGADNSEKTPRTSIGGYIKSMDNRSYCVRRPPWKAIVSPEMARNGLFRLDDDAGEKRSLLFDSSLPTARRSELSAQFLDLVGEPGRLGIGVSRRRAASGGSSPDADTERGLRSLGYIE
jgi:arylsulfatase A-like enzyme